MVVATLGIGFTAKADALVTAGLTGTSSSELSSESELDSSIFTDVELISAVFGGDLVVEVRVFVTISLVGTSSSSELSESELDCFADNFFPVLSCVFCREDRVEILERIDFFKSSELSESSLLKSL